MTAKKPLSKGHLTDKFAKTTSFMSKVTSQLATERTAREPDETPIVEKYSLKK